MALFTQNNKDDYYRFPDKATIQIKSKTKISIHTVLASPNIVMVDEYHSIQTIIYSKRTFSVEYK